jgi:hypothetical protein
MKKIVELIPFSRSSGSSELTLKVQVERIHSALVCEFHLIGDIENIIFSSLHKNPQRRDRLWETTCFEAFVTLKQDPSYWEFNAAPSGDWNLYAFKKYRLAKDAIQSVQNVPKIQFTQMARECRAKVSLDLASLLLQDQSADIYLGLTAVIENKSHEKSYWAIEHRGAQPDFHMSESFSLRI